MLFIMRIIKCNLYLSVKMVNGSTNDSLTEKPASKDELHLTWDPSESKYMALLER